MGDQGLFNVPNHIVNAKAASAKKNSLGSLLLSREGLPSPPLFHSGSSVMAYIGFSATAEIP
jgi:hypothetical protein